MKSKVILFCVLLFCSKIVDSVPHSENHVRQRVNPLYRWQINKKVPNAQYLDTDFTQPQNVNKLTNSVVQQENNEDSYQRGYNYDSYEYNKGPVSSPSAKDLLVSYDSPADGSRLDSYPPRVESYPSHTPQVGFDHQQYRNQKWRSHNPFTNSVPSLVLTPNDERPLVTPVQEPYRGLAQYVQLKHVPSSNRRFHKPEGPYLAREQLQYPSVDHSGVNKYVVNSATRFGSRGPVPYENYSQNQASETKVRPTGIRRHVQNYETPFDTNYESPAVESIDTLVDQSENIRYPVAYENYREGQVSETETRLNGVRRHVQDFKTPSEINYETPAVESADTLIDQSENIRYPVPYENYKAGQASQTKTTPTGVRRHVQDFETPSEIDYETPAVESADTLVDQSENIRYPVAYENYREGQISETKTRLNGVRRHVQDFGTPSEINYETPAVESADALVDQSENIRYPVAYENYREGQVSETETRFNGVHRHVQDFETQSEINYETPAVESADTLVDQSENIRYPVPYENYREVQVSETKTRLTGVRRHVQDFETPSEINYETPAVESADTLIDQSENIRYPVPYENYKAGQASQTKTTPTGVRRHVQDFETPSEINYETPAVESVDTDNYSSDSRPSNLAPVVNVKKEATPDILTDKPLAHKYAHRSDYRRSNIARDNSNNDAPTDPIENVEVKEGKYGAVPINRYPEDSLTPTNTVLKKSGSHTYEESNVPQYGLSSPNNSKQNAIHHLTSEIKELSLKNLVANPEIQDILSRTDKRYVVVHSNGTIEYLDTIPFDSQQDSKLRLVHTKRKNIDGSEGDGFLTPQWPQNVPSNIAKTPAPVDEYQWPTNNQPADEYDSSPVPFENLPAGHSQLKPFADGGYSKPFIPNEDEPVDDSNSNQPKDDDNSNSLAPNEAQPAYDANPNPTPEYPSEDGDNSNPLPHDVNHPTDDHILKHWTSPENQPRDDDSSKPLLTNLNQSKHKINLTPYGRNPIHVKRHKHAYATHPANDNILKPLLPNEAQPSDDRNSEPLLVHATQPAHDTKPKHSDGNQPENDDNSNPSSPNKNQPADDIYSEPLNENLSGDDIVPKRLQPYYRHHKKSKVTNSNPSYTLEPLDYYENQAGDDNTTKYLHQNENQSGDDNSKPSSLVVNQSVDDNNSERFNENLSEDDIVRNLFNPYYSHHKKSIHPHVNKSDDNNLNTSSTPEPLDYPDFFYGNQHEDDDNSKLLPSLVNQSEEDNNPNSPKPTYGNEPANDNNSKKALSDENQPEDDKKSKSSIPLPENQPAVDNNIKSPSYKNQPAGDKTPQQSVDETESTPSLSHKKQQRHYKKPKLSHDYQESDDSSAHLSSQDENQQRDDKADENQSEDETIITPLPLNKKQQIHHKKPKHSRVSVNFSVDDNDSKTSSDEILIEDDKKSKSSIPLPENQPADDNNIKSPSSYKNQPAGDKTPQQPADETESTPSLSHKKQQRHYKKPKRSHNYLESDDSSAHLSSQDENQQRDDKADENQSEDETIITPLPLNKKQQIHHKKPKHSRVSVNFSVDDNDSKTSSDEILIEDDKKSKSSIPLPENQPADDNNIKSPSSYKNQPAGDKTPQQPADETESTPSLSHKKQQRHYKKPKRSHNYLESDDNNANLSSQDENQQRDDKADENQSEDETIITPLPLNKKQQVHHKKPKHSRLSVHFSVDDNDSKTSSDEILIEDDKNSTSLSTSETQSTNDNNSKPTSPEENQPEDDIKLKPTPSVSSKNDDKSTTLSPTVPNYTTTPKPQIKKHKRKYSHHKNTTNSPVISTTLSPDDSSDEAQPEHNKKSTSLFTSENQSTNDNNSKPSSPEVNKPEDDIKSKPLSASENKPTDGLNSKRTPVSSKNDNEFKSTTLSPTIPNYTTTPKPQVLKKHKRKHRHRKTTPVVSTTPSLDDNSEDQIITLSPIEQVTDNVSDVPTLTTTTAKPVETLDKQDTYKDANNKPDEVHGDTKSSYQDQARISDKVQTSTTTATPSSSTSPTDNASDDKTKGKFEGNENKAVVRKENNGNDDKQIAVYNSSELLDTNPDVPEETNDYSPVTPSPSVQNDVDTGDASCDNSSELAQSETDITITVSSSTTYDSEDEIITINIEVSESTDTDDADSPSNDKTLVVSIDTKPDNDDDSKALQTDVPKTTKTEDCKEDHDHDDGRGKNVDIDLSNLKANPAMWMKTTNQDFIDQLTAKNDTQFDVIYFFSIENQPIIEKEKETTIFCNGTVVIETSEITYARKDDPTPTIVKTTEIMQIEDYELYR